MHLLKTRLLGTALALIRTIFAQTYTKCDPTNVTCPPTLGLASSHYSIDFTQITSQPSDWFVPTWCNVTYNTKGRKNGAELEFLGRYDSPQLYSDFYFLFGRAEFVIQAAPGPGIISDMMLLSDDLDELDWEFRGTLDTEVQTGWFGKGITGLYNHSITPQIPTPMTEFHTYAYDWTSERVNWEADGVIIRTLQASDCIGTANQYPQTPMKAMVGLWDAGDPDHFDPWSAGMTPIPPPAGGYSFYVKSVQIWNSNPAACYKWTDHSGSWQSIQILNDTTSCVAVSASPSVVSSRTDSAVSSATLLSTAQSSSVSASITFSLSDLSSNAPPTNAMSQNMPSTAVRPSASAPSQGGSSEIISSGLSMAEPLPSASLVNTTPEAALTSGGSKGLASIVPGTQASAPSTGVILPTSSLSSQISIGEPVEPASLLISASAVSTRSQAPAADSSTTELSANNILASTLQTSVNALSISGSLNTHVAMPPSVARSTLPESSFAMVETPSTLAPGIAKSSSEVLPPSTSRLETLTSSLNFAKPVERSSSPALGVTSRHKLPIVFPGHHTLSYNPIVDHMTDVLNSVDHIIHGERPSRATRTSITSTSHTRSSSEKRVAFLSSTNQLSDGQLPDVKSSVSTTLGATINYPDMTLSSDCSTTTASGGSSTVAAMFQSPSLLSGLPVGSGMFSQHSEADDILDTWRVGGTLSSSMMDSAINTGSSNTSPNNESLVATQSSLQQRLTSPSSFPITASTDMHIGTAEAVATGLRNLTVMPMRSSIGVSSGVGNVPSNQTTTSPTSSISAALPFPSGANASGIETFGFSNASRTPNVGGNGGAWGSQATTSSWSQSYGTPPLSGKSHQHQHGHLHDHLHSQHHPASLTNNNYTAKPATTSGGASGSAQEELGADAGSVPSAQASLSKLTTSAPMYSSNFSSGQNSSLQVLKTSMGESSFKLNRFLTLVALSSMIPIYDLT